MTSMVANFNKVLQALQASEASKDGELQAYEVKVKVCKLEIEAYKARVKALEAQIKVDIVAMTNSGSIQVPTAQKREAPRPPAFHGVRNTREIDNFLRGLEAYFGAMGIESDAHKVSNTALSLKTLLLFAGVVGMMTSVGDLMPSSRGN